MTPVTFRPNVNSTNLDSHPAAQPQPWFDKARAALLGIDDPASEAKYPEPLAGFLKGESPQSQERCKAMADAIFLHLADSNELHRMVKIQHPDLYPDLVPTVTPDMIKDLIEKGRHDVNVVVDISSTASADGAALVNALKTCRVRSARLDLKGVKPELVIELAEAVAGAHNLKCVDLTSTGRIDADLKPLFKAIASNKNIEVFVGPQDAIRAAALELEDSIFGGNFERRG